MLSPYFNIHTTTTFASSNTPPPLKFNGPLKQNGWVYKHQKIMFKETTRGLQYPWSPDSQNLKNQTFFHRPGLLDEDFSQPESSWDNNLGPFYIFDRL